MRDNRVNVLKKMLGMLLVAPVMLSLSLFAADPIPQHLWNLDETNGSTYLDSYGGVDGNCTLPDGCPMPTDGQVYGAQSFDGVDDVIDVNGTVFDWVVDANVTIEFWMKSNVSPMANKMMIGRQGDLGSFDLSYVAVASGGFVRAAVGSSSGLVTDWTAVTGTTIIADDQWNHIAYIVTSDMMKVYVNGVLDINVTRNGPGKAHIDTGKVTFGDLNRTGSWNYKGELDEITMYDVELNASTIQQHYLNGFKPHLVEVTPVPTPTDNVTPEYTFSSDTNGTIEIGGSCSDAIERNATAGNNTITFDTPDGTYSDCTITVTSSEADTEGNVSDPLAVSSFVVDTYVPVTPVPDTPVISSGGGGCTYNPDSKNFDMMFLLMMALGLFYPFRRRFIK